MKLVTLLHPSSSSTTPEFIIATVPIDLSGRASYLQARLAFYRYPQVIRANCNSQRFGLPPAFLRGSPCSWVDRLVSGLPYAVVNALSHLVSLCLPPLSGVRQTTYGNSPVHSSIGTTSPARRAGMTNFK